MGEYGLSPSTGGSGNNGGATAIANEERNQVAPLMGYIASLWILARDAKESKVRKEIDAGVLAIRSTYTAAQNARIEAENGMSKTYFSTTNQNARAAFAWIMDVVRRISYTITYEPPELTDDIKAQIRQGVQENLVNTAASSFAATGAAAGTDAALLAQVEALVLVAEAEWLSQMTLSLAKKAKKMTQYINEIKQRNGFMGEIKTFVSDLMWSPAAIIGGPNIMEFKKISWLKDANGITKKRVTTEKYPAHLRVNVYDVYPDPDSDDIRNSYVFEVMRLTRKNLLDLKGRGGFSSEAIDTVLLRHRGGYRIPSIDVTARKDAEGKAYAQAIKTDNTIEALVFSGYVSGEMLKKAPLVKSEIAAKIEDTDELFVNIWYVGDFPIKVQIIEDGEPAYRSMSYSNIVKSVFADSLAAVNADAQEMGNTGVRGLQTNAPYAAQPLSSVNADMVPELRRKKLSRLPPGMLLLNNADRLMGNTPPATYFGPPNNIASFLSIINAAREYASVSTGIPEAGSTVGSGAAETASGLAMIRTDSGRVIKSIIVSIEEIIIHCINDYYEYIMEFGDDEDNKLPGMVEAVGTESILAKEVRTRRLGEIMAITQGGIYGEVLGHEGAAEVLKETLKDLDVNSAVEAIDRNMAALKGGSAMPTTLVGDNMVKKETEIGNG